MNKGLKNQRGFTIVEVVVAFGLFAIISVALLQTFVLSSKVNAKALIKDKANAVLVDTLEIYKNNPSIDERDDVGDFKTAFGVGEATTVVDGAYTYIKYLDNNFEPTTSADAVYKVVATLEQDGEAKEISSYSSNPMEVDGIYVFDGISDTGINISNNDVITITLKKDAGIYSCCVNSETTSFGLTSVNISSEIINIPIKLLCTETLNSDPSKLFHMIILNYSDKEAAVFWNMIYTATELSSTEFNPDLIMKYSPEMSYGPASIFKVDEAYADDIITTKMNIEIIDMADIIIVESDASKFFYSSAT